MPDSLDWIRELLATPEQRWQHQQDAALGSQAQPQPNPQVPMPFPSPGAPHGYLDRLAMGLANTNIPEADPSNGGAAFLGGLAHGFSGSRIAEMQKRAKYEQVLNTQAHDQNVANAQATTEARKLTDAKALKAAPGWSAPKTADNAVETITGPDGKPLIVKRADAIGKAPYVKPDAPPADEPIMSPAAIKKRVEIFKAGGPEPSFGMGHGGIANRVAFNNELGLSPESGSDIQAGRSSAVAEKANLTNLTKVHGAATAFEETALKNTKILESALNGLPDAGASFLNRPLRSILSATGSKDMAKFNTARQVVVPEFTRLLNSPSAAGVITESARKEMNVIIDPNSTVGQIKTAIAILKQDAANRTQSYQDEINASQQRISQIGVPPKSAAPAGYILMNSPDNVPHWVPPNQKNQSIAHGWKLAAVK